MVPISHRQTYGSNSTIVTNVLLLIAAAIHLILTPTLRRVILGRVLTIEELLVVSPPFSLIISPWVFRSYPLGPHYLLCFRKTRPH